MAHETGPVFDTAGARHDRAAAVDVSGIARRYGHRWALRGVSLRVEPGEVAALVGHNGSGKTTLLRVIATVLRPTRGGGEVYGFDLVREADRIRDHVAVLGHAPGLYGDLTARENLAFAVRMTGMTPAPGALDAALDAVSLSPEADERVRAFSAGMQRRLALARILLRRPRLILLDEPYASLDAEGIELVNALLTRHTAEGNAAIVATHDPERAAAVVDRVWRLARGTLAAETPGAPAAARDDGARAAARAGEAPALREGGGVG